MYDSDIAGATKFRVIFNWRDKSDGLSDIANIKVRGVNYWDMDILGFQAGGYTWTAMDGGLFGG